MHVEPRSSKVCNCCQLLFFDGYAHQATAIKTQYIPVKTMYDPKELLPKVIRLAKYTTSNNDYQKQGKIVFLQTKTFCISLRLD